MSDVVQITGAVDAIADAKWRAFVAAKIAAENSLAIEDGIAAGHAWREFLAVFDKSPATAQVLTLPLRARP